jgi:hypothetical protein
MHRAQRLEYPTLATTLNGAVTDDGLPVGGTLTSVWSTVSGPGNARFAQPTRAVTTASFPAPGTYVLRLTANDGDKSASGDVTINIADGAGIDFELETSSGVVAINYGGFSVIEHEGYITVSVNGGGRKVYVSSSSGDIQISKL